MKKFLFFLALLLYYTHISLAQVDEADPLIVQFENAESTNEKITTCKKIIRKYKRKDLEKAKQYMDIGMEMANRMSVDTLKAYFLLNKGNYYHTTSELDSAILCYNQGIVIADKIGNIRTSLAFNLALSKSLRENGQVEEAAELYITSLEKAKDKNLPEIVVNASFGIANLYALQDNHEKALQYILEAEPYCTDFANDRQIFCSGTIASNIAESYFKLGKYQEAIQKAKQAEKLKKEGNYLISLDATYMTIAGAYLELDSVAEAMDYYEKARAIAEKIGKQSGIQKSKSKLINLYLDQGKYDDAGLLIKELSPIMEKSSNIYQKQEFYKSSSTYYHKIKDYPKAAAHYLEFTIINDSLFNVEKNSAVEEMRTKFETDRVEEEKIHAEQLAAKNYRTFLATLAASIFALLTGMLFYFQMRQKKKAELASAELAQVESELKALRSQMNPHFIFNSLNSIQDLVLDQETEKSYDYIVKFAELVRNTLNHSNQKFIPIEKELEFLEVYLSLEKLRFGDEFTYHINYEGNQGINVPSLLVQPFIENALLHGLLHSKREKILTVNFIRDEKELICIVEDNGVGRERARQIRQRQRPGHQSFSMEAINKRLQYLGEQYGIKAFYEFIDLKDEAGQAIGTKVNIRMPYENIY